MTARRLNGWQKGEQHKKDGEIARSASPSAFERQLVLEGIPAEFAATSLVIRNWVRQNYLRHYVPEDVLLAMGIRSDPEETFTANTYSAFGGRFRQHSAHRPSSQSDSL